jgi:ABC-type phosphate transport system substrate-binding protein
MKKMLFVLSLAVLIASSGTQASDVQVVANPGVAKSAVTVQELKDLFLGNKNTLSDGSAAEPVLAESGPAHEAFLKAYVGKSDTALRTYLKSLVFTGKASMPKSFGSDAEIVKYVAKTPGAVGYVSGSADTSSVKKVGVN